MSDSKIHLRKIKNGWVASGYEIFCAESTPYRAWLNLRILYLHRNGVIKSGTGKPITLRIMRILRYSSIGKDDFGRKKTTSSSTMKIAKYDEVLNFALQHF